MSRLPTIVVLSAALAVGAAPAMAQLMTASGTYFEARDKLTEAEMASTFSGKYHEEGTDVTGKDWSLDAMADGSVRVAAGTYTDTGHARIDGIKLCVAYTKAWRGAERCYRFAHHGKQLASYGPDGKLDSVVVVSR